MSPRRPPRPWVGSPRSIDPAEMLGPRGLTEEVLRGEDEFSSPPLYGGSSAPPGSDHIKGVRQSTDPEDLRDPAFYWSLFTPERRARIQSVVDARLASVTVVLDRLIDPHNAAAILRTAEGLGLATAHLILHDAADAVAHRRVTQDAHKWLDFEQHESGAQAAARLRERGYQVWAGHLDASGSAVDELPADRPVALLFGNEHEGPTGETLRACSGTFRIPMSGFAQSLNVSVAAGIALASLTQRRRAHLGRPGDLPQEARVELRNRFTLLAARLARRVKSGG